MVPIFNQEVHLKSVMLSSLANYAIFTAKQIYSMCRQPQKAAVFSAKPTLNWIISKDNMNDHDADKEDIVL